MHDLENHVDEHSQLTGDRVLPNTEILYAIFICMGWMLAEGEMWQTA